VILILVVGAVASIWWLARRTDTLESGLVVSGTVEATEGRIGFQAPGRIERLDVREGDRVEAGDLMGALNTSELLARRTQAEAQVAAARATLDELEAGSRPEEIARARAVDVAAAERLVDAERDLGRARELYEGGAVSREVLDKAELGLAEAGARREEARQSLRLVEAGPRPERIAAAGARLLAAEAAVRVLEVTLANAELRAPFNGIVTVRHREPGEVVSAGVPVVTIMNPADRWVRIFVPESRVGAVFLGQPASITSDTYPDRSYAGVVSHVASEAEFTPKNVQTPEERSKLVYAVKVRVEGDEALELKPGMPADVRLELQ
jgi:membrane fusion protein YbhG